MFLQCNFVTHRRARSIRARSNRLLPEGHSVGLRQAKLGVPILMKTIARRFAIVLSATAVTVGLMGAAAPADAAKGGGSSSLRDTSWD
jgi:hypothetical protein